MPLLEHATRHAGKISRFVLLGWPLGFPLVLYLRCVMCFCVFVFSCFRSKSKIQNLKSKICCLALSPTLLFAQPASYTWADTVQAKQALSASRDYHKREQHGPGKDAAMQARKIFEQLYGPTHPRTALADLCLARHLRAEDRLADAVPILERCLPIFKEAHDTLHVCNCYVNLAICFKRLNRLEAALAYNLRVLELVRHDTVNHANIIAATKINIADCYIHEQRFKTALPWLESARKIYESSKSKDLASAYYFTGEAYFGLGDYARAQTQYLASYALIKEDLPKDHSYFADLLVRLGFCSQKMGQSAQGLSYFFAARDFYLKQESDTSHNYIAFLQYLGEFYTNSKQYEAAIWALDSCLSARAHKHKPESPRLLGTLRLLGEAHARAQHWEVAERTFRRGLRIQTEALKGNYPLAFRFYAELAEIYRAKGDLKRCLNLCDTAFTAAHFDGVHPETVLPRNFFRELLQTCGTAHQALWAQNQETAHLTQAERCFRLATECLYREVSDISEASDQTQFYHLDYDAVEQWVDVALMLYEATGERRHAEHAFQATAHSKGLLLAEAIRRSQLLQHQNLPDSLLEKERALRTQLENLALLGTGSAPSNSDTVREAEWKNGRKLTILRERYDAVLQDITALAPSFTTDLHNLPTPPIRALQQILPPDQDLLVFSLTQTSLAFFVLNRDTFMPLRQPLGGNLSADIAAFRRCLTAPFANISNDALYDRSLDTLAVIGQSLFEQLLRPVWPFLRRPRLAIVPDGILYHLPFEALFSGKPKDLGNFKTYPFLLRDKALSYWLSPYTLLEDTLPTNTRAPKRWMGMAPSVSPSLPHADREVRRIAQAVGGNYTAGRPIDLAFFQAAAQSYQTLHLATHCRMDESPDAAPYIALSDSFVLTPQTLRRCALRARMVVLSACASGQGTLRRGEGIIGLVRAFAQAGVPCVVASQWVVDDEAAATLMLAFYENTALPKDLALQKAALRLLLQSPMKAHPFYWAGFRVYGSTEF